MEQLEDTSMVKKMTPAYQSTRNLPHNFLNLLSPAKVTRCKTILENCLEVLFHHLILHH